MVDLILPPYGNTTIGPLVNITSGALLFVAVTIYGLRIYVRFRNLSLEDYVITVAVAISLTEFALVCQASRYGFGRHNYYVSAENKSIVFRYLFGVVIIGLWSATLVRVSVALMLLRLKNTRSWKILLRTIVAIQIVSMVGVNICQLLQCRPIRAMWDMVPSAQCWTAKQMATYGYVHTSLGAACDIFFTGMLLSLIRTLHRHRSEKILLGCLMSLGTFASAAAIVKIVYMHLYDLQGDSLRIVIIITLLVRIEEAIGIIAACSPYLKNMVASCLGYLGIKLQRGSVWYLSTFMYRSRAGPPLVVAVGRVESVERTGSKRSATTIGAITIESQGLETFELPNRNDFA
ncbi:hypothetical protein BKA66DRAFT_521609 [Pyrenochaeta sp. MPI-SDFR-AT-0127]|nr:hypothetical protein BKA66DRAFT_521609 [Pyrenochaeta sp. MPI-SDFR-AT-0127]